MSAEIKVRNYSSETFKIVLWETYDKNNQVTHKDADIDERRELHCTFSVSFYESELYKKNGSPKFLYNLRAPEIQNLAEKSGIFLYLHNLNGAAIERFSFNGDGSENVGKRYQNVWINGEQLPFDEFEEYEVDGKKLYRFKNNALGLSEKALKVIHNGNMFKAMDSLLNMED